MVEPVNFKKWTEQRELVDQLGKNLANGIGDIEALVAQTARLQTTTAGVIDAVINDMQHIHQLAQVLQVQIGNVAQQSFLGLEMLKKKGVATNEEIHELFESIMAKKLAEVEAEEAEFARQAEQSETPMTESPDKIAEYEALLKSGFSDHDARSTVWPDLEVTAGAEIVQFPGRTKNS